MYTHTTLEILPSVLWCYITTWRPMLRYRGRIWDIYSARLCTADISLMTGTENFAEHIWKSICTRIWYVKIFIVTWNYDFDAILKRFLQHAVTIESPTLFWVVRKYPICIYTYCIWVVTWQICVVLPQLLLVQSFALLLLGFACIESCSFYVREKTISHKYYY